MKHLTCNRWPGMTLCEEGTATEEGEPCEDCAQVERCPGCGTWTKGQLKSGQTRQEAGDLLFVVGENSEGLWVYEAPTGALETASEAYLASLPVVVR